MRESAVEQHLVKRVTQTGGEVRKVKWIGRNGAPDRLVGWPDRHPCILEGEVLGWYRAHQHALIELKRPKGPTKAHQEREHERLRAIGFDVRVLDTIEAVDEFVKEMVG